MGTMSLTEVMDKSIVVLKKYMKTIVTYNLAYGILSSIGVFGFIIGGAIFITLAIVLKLNAVLIAIVSSILGVGIFAAVMSFKIGLIKISSQDFIEENIYTFEAIEFSLKKVFKVLGVIIMEVLLFLPIVAIFAFITYLIYDSLQYSMMFLGIYDKNELGLIILSIMLILLAILSFLAYITIFTFSFHAVAIENKGVFAALKRSYMLVKGDYFKILGCTILFNLTIYAITYSLQSFLGIMFSILYLLLKFLSVQQDLLAYASMMYSVSSWPISILSWLVITPIGTIMITHLYYNQRFRKEGYDIVLKLKRIQRNEEKVRISEGNQYNNSIKQRI